VNIYRIDKCYHNNPIIESLPML